MAEFIKKPQNTYLFGLLALFITLYGPRLSPKLPEPIQELFEKTWFRAAVMFLAVYLAQRDFRVSLLVTVVFLVLMNIVQNTNVFETFLQNYEQSIEGFAAADLTGPQQKCAQTIGQVFKGKDIKLPETHSNLPENDDLTTYMDTSSKMALSDGNLDGINRARSWCQQFGNSTAMHGVPDGDKVVAGCQLIESSCNPDSWLQDTEGSKVSVPKFYQGVCGPIKTDTKNWVVKKPQCFNRDTPESESSDCTQYSQGECQSHKDKCYWGDPISGFKNSNVKIPGGNHSVVCVPQHYPNTNCEPNFTYGKEVAKNAKDGEPSYKFTPPGCVEDMQYNSHTGEASYPGNACVHSGQCCGYAGEGKKGSHCMISDKGNFCMNIDPSSGTTYSNTFILPAYKIAQSDDPRFSTEDVQNMQLKDFKAKTGSFNKLVAPPTTVQTSFGKGADWANVYYNDPQSKAKKPATPGYPKDLFIDSTGKMGLGCWVPETGVPKGSQFFAKMSPREAKTEKTQYGKKVSDTANYKSGFGLVGNIEQFQGGSSGQQVSEGFVGHAPPVSDCRAYNPQETKFTGTAYYPLNDNNHLQHQQGALPNQRPAYSGEVDWQHSVNA